MVPIARPALVCLRVTSGTTRRWRARLAGRHAGQRRDPFSNARSRTPYSCRANKSTSPRIPPCACFLDIRARISRHSQPFGRIAFSHRQSLESSNRRHGFAGQRFAEFCSFRGGVAGWGGAFVFRTMKRNVRFRCERRRVRHCERSSRTCLRLQWRQQEVRE